MVCKSVRQKNGKENHKNSSQRAIIGILCLCVVFCAHYPPLFGQTEFRSSQGETVRFPASVINSQMIRRGQGLDVAYSTNFGTTSDLDEDLWPDGWTQFFGEGFPRYGQARIAARRTPFGSGCLQIPVQRGGVTLFSPRVEISHGLTYVGNAQVFSRGLQHDRVFISLSLLDSDGRILKTTVSEFVVNTEGWIPLATAPITADHPAAHSVSVGLHVVPLVRQDLAGLVEFGQIDITQQPTIQFDRKSPWQLYTRADEIEISGRITASSASWYGAKLEIRDARGQVLDSRPLAERGRENDGNADSGDEWSTGNVGQYGFRWQPEITEPGYYTVILSLPMPGIDPYTLEPKGASQSISFALLEPCGTIVNGDFGWSLPGDTTIDQCRELVPLLEAAAISRLKFPAWLSETSPESTWQQYTLFCEWLAARRIRAVGVLATPPAELLAAWQRRMNIVRNDVPIPQLQKAPTANAVNVPATNAAETNGSQGSRPTLDIGFAGNIFLLPSEHWLPSIEATVFRLGMVVPDWQLGRDDDRSLMGFEGLESLLGEMDSRFQRQGLDASFGLPWDWVYPFPQFPPENNEQTYRGFLSLDNEWPLTVDDLAYYLDAADGNGVARHVMLDLIDRRRYPLDGRVIDLVRRMIAVKEHGAEAVFLARPFDPDFGLFDPVGEPRELFLPWRTTALMISGKLPVGGFSMPRGSENHLFRGAGGTVMALWNETPCDEVLFLGKDSMIVDVWGRKIRPTSENHRQTIPVGPVPIFVTNLYHDVAMIRQNFRLENADIPSRYGAPIPNRLYFMNTSGDAMDGQLTIVPPDGVTVDPDVISVHLMAGETAEQALTFRLNARAVSGEQMLRVDVQTGLTDARLFSIFQPINIGGGDVSIDLSTRLNRNGELEVHQAFLNDGQTPVNFTCTLYIPNRPLQKMQVQKQGFGRADYTYTIPNGRSLIGKTLRVVGKEIGSQRVLKYELKASP